MMEGCSWLLLPLLLLLTILWSTDAFLWSDGMTITPIDPIFIIGKKNISLICTSNHTQSAENLYFENANREVIDKKYLTILSPTQIKLEIPAVSQNQSGYYNCMDNGTNVVAGMDIRVGFPPEAPKDFRCVSENFDSMTCSWCPSDQDPSPYIVWELQWRVGSHTGNCSQKRPTSCSCYLCGKIPETSHPFYKHCSNREVPQFLRTATYDFTVTAKNMYGQAESKFYIEPDSIVKPSIVPKISSTPVALTSDRKAPMVNVSWDAPPTVANFLTLKYNLTYKCDWDHNSTVLMVEGKLYQVLGNLFPDTKYVVHIRSKPVVGGYWSDDNSMEFVSPETVPLASPKIINYRRTDCTISTNCFNLIIYWQPIDAMFVGSVLNSYTLSWNSSDGRIETKSVPKNSWSYEFAWFDKNKSYDINVTAMTKKGKSQPGRYYIPAYQEGISPVKVEGVRLDQKNQDNKNFINISMTSDNPTASFGLFYCKTPRGSRSIQTCESDVKEVRFNMNSSYLHDTIEYPAGDHYMFSVAGYSSQFDYSFGLQPWLCIWKQCGDVEKPSLSTSTDTSEDRSLVLNLKTAECRDMSGKVHHISLSIEGPGYKNSTIIEPVKKLVIPGLQPYSEYTVTVEALGDPKCDPQMKSRVSKKFKTPESLPSPPVNVTVKLQGKDNDTLIVAWQPSTHPNGILKFGTVLVQGHNKNYTNETIPEYIHKRNDLPGYQNYTVLVRVNNSAGMSEWSAPQVIRMPMRAPSVIDPESLEGVYVEKEEVLNVTWSSPKMLNGPDPEFIVNIKTGKTNQIKKVHGSTQALVGLDGGCKYSKITVIVEAKNCEDGKCYKSSPAEKIISPCDPIEKGFQYISVIGIGIVLFVILLICLGYRLHKRRKKMSRDLRNEKAESIYPLSDTSSIIADFKINKYLASQTKNKNVQQTVDEGVACEDSDYENNELDEPDSCLLNAESDPPYGQVTEDSHISNGIIPNGDLSMSPEPLKKVGSFNDEVVGPGLPSAASAEEPLLKDVVHEPAGYGKILTMNYDDYLFIQLDESGSEKPSSYSSDVTSPSTSGESTEYTPLSPDCLDAPVVNLPDKPVKLVPVVTLPNNIIRGSQSSVASTASDVSSAEPTAPTVHKPVSLNNGVDSKHSDDSDSYSLASDSDFKVPTVKIPPLIDKLPSTKLVRVHNDINA